MYHFWTKQERTEHRGLWYFNGFKNKPFMCSVHPLSICRGLILQSVVLLKLQESERLKKENSMIY